MLGAVLRGFGHDNSPDAQAEKSSKAQRAQHLQGEQDRTVFLERADVVSEIRDETAGGHGRCRRCDLLGLLILILTNELVLGREACAADTSVDGRYDEGQS